MGAYPNRSGEHVDQQKLGLADTRTATMSRTGEQTETRASCRNAPTIEPITMRVPDACRYIGVSRSTLYVLIAEGEVEIVKLGCSTLVLTESLKALIAQRRGPSDDRSEQTGV